MVKSYALRSAASLIDSATVALLPTTGIEVSAGVKNTFRVVCAAAG
jgi:hypothetical protein